MFLLCFLPGQSSFTEQQWRQVIFNIKHTPSQLDVFQSQIEISRFQYGRSHLLKIGAKNIERATTHLQSASLCLYFSVLRQNAAQDISLNISPGHVIKPLVQSEESSLFHVNQVLFPQIAPYYPSFTLFSQSQAAVFRCALHLQPSPHRYCENPGFSCLHTPLMHPLTVHKF